MRAPTAVFFAIIAASLPSVVHAQAHVTQIVGPDGSAVGITDDVELIPFGSVRPVEVKLDTDLGIGDELRAKSGKSIVVLACSDTAGVTLQGDFRALIMPRPEGKACFLDLLAGAAHVVGDTSTGLGLGDVMMGAKRTHYRVTLSREADGVHRELEVFDGEVEVRSSAQARPIEVPAGYSVAVARSGYDREPISRRQIESAARLYAYVDASRTKPDVRTTAVHSLTGAYQRVLAHPDSVAARLDLIAEQVKYEATNRTTLYQIERVRATAPRTSQLEATTTALSVAAYTQLGEEEKAASRYESLRSYDQQTLQSALRAYRIDPELIQRAGRFDARVSRAVDVDRVQRPGVTPEMTRDTLSLRAWSDPETIRNGGRSRIIVKVVSGAGTAVEGAKVRVSAGGGAFASGGTEADGLTDADGTFSVVWSCSNCAAGYAFSVDVAKEGFVSAGAKVGVRVQY